MGTVQRKVISTETNNNKDRKVNQRDIKKVLASISSQIPQLFKSSWNNGEINYKPRQNPELKIKIVKKDLIKALKNNDLNTILVQFYKLAKLIELNTKHSFQPNLEKVEELLNNISSSFNNSFKDLYSNLTKLVSSIKNETDGALKQKSLDDLEKSSNEARLDLPKC